tara:strand:+ start:259 stop:1329 length:1071 start_codon:yes stop_codon:yes gene_type:complete
MKSISENLIIKLKIKDIIKKFDETAVLKDVNLEVNEKDFIVILGPSGCGKTTLLRIIAGLENQNSGEVFIENNNVSKVPPQDRNISMVFQNYGLYPHLTVKQNLEYPLKINKIKNRDQIIKKWATKVKIEELLARYPRQLSGGQRQRVALGRSLVRNPKLFLMDEPLSNLDASLRLEMRSEIKHLHEELGTTIIYVTHDQIEAMTLATRIVLMNKGIIEQVGTPKELYSAPKNIFVGSFIGSPPMNFIPGKIKNGTFNSDQIQSFNVSINTEADVILGIRPDDLHIGDNNSYDFKAELYASEFLGEGYLITFNLGNSKLLLKSQKNIEFKTKERIPILIDKNKFLLFDYNSKKRIY